MTLIAKDIEEARSDAFWLQVIKHPLRQKHAEQLREVIKEEIRLREFTYEADNPEHKWIPKWISELKSPEFSKIHTPPFLWWLYSKLKIIQFNKIYDIDYEIYEETYYDNNTGGYTCVKLADIEISFEKWQQYHWETDKEYQIKVAEAKAILARSTYTPPMHEHLGKDKNAANTRQNLFNSPLPLEEVERYFMQLATEKSKNGKQFLSESDVKNFIDRAFCNVLNLPQLTLNIDTREYRFVISLFYQFYSICVTDRRIEDTIQIKHKYVSLLCDNFTNFPDPNKVSENFNKKPGRKWPVASIEF